VAICRRHPTPSATRCVVQTEKGRVFFDSATDLAPARDVPPEAHRRFRADLRAKRDHNLKTRAEQLAQHEEKKRFAATWIAEHGTPDQRARQAAGVLPMEEAIEAMTDHAFAALADIARYVADGPARIQDAAKRLAPGSEPLVSTADVIVTSNNAETMTAAQWAVVGRIRERVPGATVVLRVHNVSWKKGRTITAGPFFGVRVTQCVGPFTVRREFAVEDGSVK
jgi:hypothetical protein